MTAKDFFDQLELSLPAKEIKAKTLKTAEVNLNDTQWALREEPVVNKPLTSSMSDSSMFPAEHYAHTRILSSANHAFKKLFSINPTPDQERRLRKIYPHVCTGKFDLEVMSEAFFNMVEVLYLMQWYQKCNREHYGHARLHEFFKTPIQLPRFERSVNFLTVPRESDSVYYFIYNYSLFFEIFTWGRLTTRGRRNESVYIQTDTVMSEVAFVKSHFEVESWREFKPISARKEPVWIKRAGPPFKRQGLDGIKIRGSTPSQRLQSFRSQSLKDQDYLAWATNVELYLRNAPLEPKQKKFIMRVVNAKMLDIMDTPEDKLNPWELEAIQYLIGIPQSSHMINRFREQFALFSLNEESNNAFWINDTIPVEE